MCVEREDAWVFLFFCSVFINVSSFWARRSGGSPMLHFLFGTSGLIEDIPVQSRIKHHTLLCLSADRKNISAGVLGFI